MTDRGEVTKTRLPVSAGASLHVTALKPPLLSVEAANRILTVTRYKKVVPVIAGPRTSLIAALNDAALLLAAGALEAEPDRDAVRRLDAEFREHLASFSTLSESLRALDSSGAPPRPPHEVLEWYADLERWLQAEGRREARPAHREADKFVALWIPRLLALFEALYGRESGDGGACAQFVSAFLAEVASTITPHLRGSTRAKVVVDRLRSDIRWRLREHRLPALPRSRRRKNGPAGVIEGPRAWALLRLKLRDVAPARRI